MGSTDTRERIVTGAEAAFAERGPAVTVEEVLRAADLSRRTFYQHFQSKDDVLRAVYDRRMDELVAALAAAVATPVADPVERVLAGIDAWLDVQQAGGAPYVALQGEAVRADSLLHPRREATLDALAHTIDLAVRDALGVEADPLVYRGLVLGIEGLVLHLAQQGQLGAERARLRRVAAALVLGVLANARELPAPPRVTAS